MGLFGKKKILDLSGGYSSSAKRRAKQSSKQEDSSLGFLGNLAGSNSDNSSGSDISWDNDSQSNQATVGEYQEKKQKLANRLLDMTNKIEDLSNQVYHLKQRIELLEKKMKISYN